MNLQYCAMVIGLIVLLFFVGAGGSLASARQDNGTHGSTATPPMSMAVAANELTDPKILVKNLHLMAYEAAKGDLSLCADDLVCLKYAKWMKSWLCADAVCDGTDKSKKLIDCFGSWKADKYTKEEQDQIDSSFCSLMESPSTLTRQALMSHVHSGMGEDGLVELGAYIMAFKGSAGSCENYIKDYVGAYGPKWNYKWYRALSGCRIFAHQRTRQQEENDFYTWFGVVRGLGICSDIVNREMRNACSAPGATSPIPVYGR